MKKLIYINATVSALLVVVSLYFFLVAPTSSVVINLSLLGAGIINLIVACILARKVKLEFTKRQDEHKKATARMLDRWDKEDLRNGLN